ncbi:MAG TPA: DUF885 domain-containing protein [Myxococcaceae bacterium]|jgi:uncharacterized protein (DUF885 family)
MSASDGDSVGAVAADFWDWQLRENPEMATALGDYRFDARLTDLSADAFARRGMEARALVRRLDAIGPQAGEDAITADVLRHHLAEPIDADRLRLAEIAVDQMDGPQVAFPRLMSRHPLRDAGDLANLAARYQTFPVQMEQYISNLREGLAKRRAAPRVVVERVLAQLRDCLAEEPSSSAFVQGRPAEFRTELSIVTSQCVFPGYRALLEFLERDYLPRARADVGLWALPGGYEVYAFAIRQRAGTRQTPADLHQLGVRELERIEREVRAIVRQQDRRSLEQWKAADPRFADREAMLAAYRGAVERFHGGLPAGFTCHPPVALHVEAIPGYMERGAPSLHYEPPSGDGARPALLLVNISQAEAQLRYPMEAQVAHEAAPGRHLMVSLAPGLSGLPAVRRALVPGFSEGWAMYAERLADELGLYSDDRARLGMLLAQSWRAARLVVDTGMHALKWTREHAIESLMEISVAARSEAEAEVDRTIAWPAQGMADAVGALELASARSDAEKALGARFSRQAFHDRLLASGPVPLQTMRRSVLEWALGPLNPEAAPGG